VRYRVLVEPPAIADLDHAFEWITGRSPEAARRWVVHVLEAIDTLETNPERCGLAPESPVFPVEIRQLLFGRRAGRYRILFMIAGRTVHVLHVRHGARRTLAGAKGGSQ